MEYFNFTKKERAGIYALLAIILLFIIVPFVLPFFVPQETYDPKDFKTSIAKLTAKKYDSSIDNHLDEKVLKKINTDYAGIELFYFDPNTLSAEGWKKLGVKDKTIQTIQKYLAKGGKFYKPEDISKIWGLQKADANRMIPFVKIAAEKKQEKTYTNVNEYAPLKKEAKPLVDINTADTTAFIALPFIAGKLANRIITFRDKLGGFYSINQVGETFGLRDSVFQIIKSRLVITNATVKQININKATADEMKTHPYIRYAIANAIVQYRTQHGNFSSIADIKKIVLVTDDIFIKLAPYLTVN